MSVETSPRVSGVVPRVGVTGTNYQRGVEVRSGSEADATRTKVARSRRDRVRRAGPEPEGASTSDQIK